MILNNSGARKEDPLEASAGIAHDGKPAYAVAGPVVFGSIGSAFGQTAVFLSDALKLGTAGSLSRFNDANGNTPHN